MSVSSRLANAICAICGVAGKNQPNFPAEGISRANFRAALQQALGDSHDLLGHSPAEKQQVDEWLSRVVTKLADGVTPEWQVFVNAHLLRYCFLAGGLSLTVADIVVYTLLHASVVRELNAKVKEIVFADQPPERQPLLRWFDTVQSTPGIRRFCLGLALVPFKKPEFPWAALEALDAREGDAEEQGPDLTVIGHRVVPAPAPAEHKHAATAADTAPAPHPPPKAHKTVGQPSPPQSRPSQPQPQQPQPEAQPAPQPALPTATKEKPPAAKKEKKPKEPAAAADTPSKKAKDEGKAASGDGEKDIALIGRMNIRVGRVTSVETHPSSKLYVLKVDVGEEAPRVVVSGLVDYVTQEALLNRLVCVAVNLKPREMEDGLVSNGLVFAATSADGKTKEIIEPPAGSPVSERVTFGSNWHPPADAQVPPKKFHDILKGLHVDAAGVAQYNALSFLTNAGPCKAATITNGKMA